MHGKKKYVKQLEAVERITVNVNGFLTTFTLIPLFPHSFLLVGLSLSLSLSHLAYCMIIAYAGIAIAASIVHTQYING